MLYRNLRLDTYYSINILIEILDRGKMVQVDVLSV